MMGCCLWKLINHAKEKKQKFVAGVGFANAEDFEKTDFKNQDYILNYEGN